ncbi:MAG: glutamate--cysteine ligase [Deltaproteobacteria bacterium]|nr:glutamate--cysteine ligase [Deltaproteobacteria bacterium]
MIDALAKKFKKKEAELTAWFQNKAGGVVLPITISVDIRNAGFKIAVVDTNVFPAGFNNLCNNFSKIAAQNFSRYLEAHVPKAKKLLIVPETFTRNLNYFENVKALENLLKLAGYEVAVGFLGDPLPGDPHEVGLLNGAILKLERMSKKEGRALVGSMNPDALILNNDCSDGIPQVLQNIEQPIFPSPELGWHSRRKKHHFLIYCQLIEEVAKIVDTDCWRLCPITTAEHDVDFGNGKDIGRVAEKIEKVLQKTGEKYKKYGIDEKPYVFVKSSAGTFGLGVTHVESAQDFLNLNRKGRQKLASAKGTTIPSEFLIQEGIPTADSFDGAPIEPVLYFIGGESVGGFFRIHEEKDTRSSLNAPGARFESLCFHKTKEVKPGHLELHCDDHEDFFTISKWLGKVATLAAGMENAATPARAGV